MSSSADIVTRALKRIRVIDANETPAAEDASNGLEALNAMVASWAAKGVNVSSDIPLPAKHEAGIIALLAVRLSSDYGADVSQQLAIDARDGWFSLQADYIRAPDATFDTALTKMPSQRYVTFGGRAAWRPVTAYGLNEQVTNAGNVYQVTTAGTSGTGNGPTGTDASITDGSVVWMWVEAI